MVLSFVVGSLLPAERMLTLLENGSRVVLGSDLDMSSIKSSELIVLGLRCL